MAGSVGGVECVEFRPRETREIVTFCPTPFSCAVVIASSYLTFFHAVNSIPGCLLCPAMGGSLVVDGGPWVMGTRGK